MREISINDKPYSPIGGFVTGAQIKEMGNIAPIILSSFKWQDQYPA